MPKKIENNVVRKELRHGWWKINDIEEMNAIIHCLHIRGVREKNLRASLLGALTESIDLTTPCPLANPRAPPPVKGYFDPEPMNAWNPKIAHRVDVALFEQVEALEDKVASASMQMKGWNVPTRDSDSDSGLEFLGFGVIRDRILGLEAAIERRYLKPPLGTK
jgi:hypothetical protein